MWTLILFKYMLYRLRLNRFLLKKLNVLSKGKLIRFSNYRKIRKIRNTNTIKKYYKNVNTTTTIVRHRRNKINHFYLYSFIKAFLINKANQPFNWSFFLSGLYREFHSFDALFKKEVTDFYNIHDYIPSSKSISYLNLYSKGIVNHSYDLPLLNVLQGRTWLESHFSSKYDYISNTFYLNLFVFFLSNFYLYRNEFFIFSLKNSKNNINIKHEMYLLYSNKITFFLNLECRTDVINLMFYDLMLTDYSRVWFSNSYTYFFNMYLSYKHRYDVFFNKHFFYFLTLFYDIEYTQLWLFKYYEDKAMAFNGYGEIICLYKMHDKFEVLSSSSRNALTFEWVADADLTELIVFKVKKSRLLWRSHSILKNKKTFYDYY